MIILHLRANCRSISAEVGNVTSSNQLDSGGDSSFGTWNISEITAEIATSVTTVGGWRFPISLRVMLLNKLKFVAPNFSDVNDYPTFRP